MKKLFGSVALAALVAMSAQPASAQYIDMNSSLSVSCDADCSVLKFLLELPGVSTVDGITFNSNSQTWQFGGLVAVLDEAGKEIDVAWITGRHPDEFTLYFQAESSPEPINLIVDMQAWGNTTQLPDVFSYAGQGFAEAGHLARWRGTAVPEPSTMLMLLTGLIALGVMYRRRELGLTA